MPCIIRGMRTRGAMNILKGVISGVMLLTSFQLGATAPATALPALDTCAIGSALAPSMHFNPCADLDTSRFEDMR